MLKTEDKLRKYYTKLGELIKRYRLAKGMTLEELGLRVGLDPSSIYNIEKGRNITVLSLIKLAVALDKKPSDFLKIEFDFTSDDNDSLGRKKKSK